MQMILRGYSFNSAITMMFATACLELLTVPSEKGYIGNFRQNRLKAFIPATVACTVHGYRFIVPIMS